MKKYEYFENILTNLNILRYIIYSWVNLGYYDTNKQVENFYKELLNKVYGWSLANKNEIAINYPGIDLGCSRSKIAIQVTSQNSYTKIDDTLVLCDKYYTTEYNRIIIFILTKKSNHSKDFTSIIPFNKNTDIIDIDDLLEEIEKKETHELESISTFIKNEIPYYIGKITGENDILRGRVDYQNVKPRNFGKFLEISESEKDFEDFKNKALEIHGVLLSISQRERIGLFVFFSKLDDEAITLNINTWVNVLKDSFEFKTYEIRDLIPLFQKKWLLYNDEDDELPSLCLYNSDFWLNVLLLINDMDLLHDLIVNVNFSLLDK